MASFAASLIGRDVLFMSTGLFILRMMGKRLTAGMFNASSPHVNKPFRPWLSLGKSLDDMFIAT